ncbi:MAG: uroporphyrinogen-III synthase [Candidatus Tectomicrobia bacterium]
MNSPASKSDAASVSDTLQGKRILITRAREQAAELEHRLQALGAVSIAFPTIRITPPLDQYAALDAALQQLASFDWAVFTSVNGVEHVWQRLQALGLDARAFTQMRLAAIGPATAAALMARNLEVEVMPDRYVAEALLEAMPNPDGQRLLLPRADIAREALRIGLQAAGAEVVEVPAYHTVRVDPGPEALAALEDGVDILTFTSNSTVHNFVAQVGRQRTQALAAHALVITIGPITADTAREQGLRVDAVATEYTIAGLVDAILATCRQR